MRMHLGAFVWRSEPGFTGWYPPAGVRYLIDLRPLADQARRGGAAPSRVLLVADDDVSLPDAVQIASDPEEALTGARLSQLREALGVTRSDHTRLSDLLFEALTAQGDHEGLRACPNLMPGRDGHLELITGPMRRRARLEFDSPAWTTAQRQYHRTYRQLHADEAAGVTKKGHHRRVLMSWLEQFGLRDSDFERFVPGDLPKDGPLPHQTTITESFDQANSTTLGPDLSWTEFNDMVAGSSWRTHTSEVSVEITGGTTGHMARAESDVSSSNHAAQLIARILNSAGHNNQIGVAVRWASAALTAYINRVLRVNDTLDVSKVITGTLTVIGAAVSVTISLPQTIILDGNGSTLTSTYGGVQTHSFTDSAIAGNTRGGIFGYANDGPDFATGDNWQLADDAAAAAPFFARLGALQVGR